MSVNRGPIERAQQLATLAVNSAGPDLAIPGLSPDEAEQLKQFIIEHSDAATDDSPADHDPDAAPAPAATPLAPNAASLPPPPPPS